MMCVMLEIIFIVSIYLFKNCIIDKLFEPKLMFASYYAVAVATSAAIVVHLWRETVILTSIQLTCMHILFNIAFIECVTFRVDSPTF